MVCDICWAGRNTIMSFFCFLSFFLPFLPHHHFTHSHPPTAIVDRMMEHAIPTVPMHYKRVRSRSTPPLLERKRTITTRGGGGGGGTGPRTARRRASAAGAGADLPGWSSPPNHHEAALKSTSVSMTIRLREYKSTSSPSIKASEFGYLAVRQKP